MNCQGCWDQGTPHVSDCERGTVHVIRQDMVQLHHAIFDAIDHARTPEQIAPLNKALYVAQYYLGQHNGDDLEGARS